MGVKFNVVLALFAIFVGLLAPRLFILVGLMDTFKPFVPLHNSENCQVVAKDFEGSSIVTPSFEDIIYVRLHNNEVAGLTCSGDFLTLWHRNASNAKSGACYLVDPQDPTRLSVVPFEGFPSHVAFHGHGIFYSGFNELNVNGDLDSEYLKKKTSQQGGEEQEGESKKGKRYPFVFVVNHAYSKGGERVEVFELRDPEGHGYVMTYRGSIGAEYLTKRFNGILNDLVVDIPRRTMYISQYLPVADAPTGRTNPETLEQKLGNTLLKIQTLAGTLNTILWRCEISQDFVQLMEPLPATGRVPRDTEKHIHVNHCENVAENHMLANGVQAVNIEALQQKIIFQNDFILKTIFVYATAISSSSGTPTDDVAQYQPDHNPLILIGKVKLPHCVDNIEFSRLSAHHHPTSTTSGSGGFYNQQKTDAVQSAKSGKWKFAFFGGQAMKLADAAESANQPEKMEKGGLGFIEVTLIQNGSTTSGLSLLEDETTHADVVVHEGLQGGTASGIVLPATADIGSIKTGTIGKMGGYNVVMGSWRDKGAAVCKINEE